MITKNEMYEALSICLLYSALIICLNQCNQNTIEYDHRCLWISVTPKFKGEAKKERKEAWLEGSGIKRIAVNILNCRREPRMPRIFTEITVIRKLVLHIKSWILV